MSKKKERFLGDCSYRSLVRSLGGVGMKEFADGLVLTDEEWEFLVEHVRFFKDSSYSKGHAESCKAVENVLLNCSGFSELSLYQLACFVGDLTVVSKFYEVASEFYEVFLDGLRPYSGRSRELLSSEFKRRLELSLILIAKLKDVGKRTAKRKRSASEARTKTQEEMKIWHQKRTQ